MDSIHIPDSAEVAHNFVPVFRVLKDGRVERFLGSPHVPASEDPNNSTTTGVLSKDVILSPENKVGARIFLPAAVKTGAKLPLLVYYHGGAFAIESAFSTVYTNYLSSVVSQADIIAVSVEYRLAPEHPIPACYEDCWTVTKWVGAHANNQGPEPWLSEHADFERVFFAGDSAGGNIAHNMAAKASANDGPGHLKPVGMILAHPYFGNGKPEKLWEYICSDFNGWEDPRLNPMAQPTSSLAGLVCKKVLIVTSETDFLRDRGTLYCEALKKSGWGGDAEFVDYEKDGHVFHLLDPSCVNAAILMKRVVSFLTEK